MKTVLTTDNYPLAIARKIENEEKLWKCVAEKRDYIPYLPPRITFITSKRCNLACRMCYHFRHKYMANVSPMNMPVMDPRLVHKVAEELFPTLQYYETTLLGDPFLSPHLETEIALASKYNVYMRPTTNGTTLTDENLDLVSGHVDWLKCSFDSHIRGIYNSIRIGARFDNTVRKLRNFNRRREAMNPRPYFRMGLVLNDMNVGELSEYFLWCHEYMGVDDVEIMGINVDMDYIEALAVFDKAAIVNRALDKLIETALTKKYKLRLDFTRMPTLGGDKFVCQKRSAELREQQKEYGFVPPCDFEKMSYVIQNPRNRWEIGDVGYVWSNNMREQNVCLEFMNRPFIIDNGNVEACGNCNTFMAGNLKINSFAQIWNNELYRYVRRRMYDGEINKDWPDACNDCICMGVTYDRGRSDHRHKPFYRVVGLGGNNKEIRVPVGVTHRRNAEFPVNYDLQSYIDDLKARAGYEHMMPATTGIYASDLDAKHLRRVGKMALDRVNAFCPLLLDKKIYHKGVFSSGPGELLIKIPANVGALKGVAGIFDNRNPGRHILRESASPDSSVKIEFMANGASIHTLENITADEVGRAFDVPVASLDEVSIIISVQDDGAPVWAVLADLRFE